MQRIAVMSDTHWRRWDPEDPAAAELDALLAGGFDAVWHGGDVVEEQVLLHLETYAPLTVVRGNCDRWFEREVPHAVVRKIEEITVAMIHGWDLPLEHLPTVVKTFPEEVDIIIHGHTHRRRRDTLTRTDGRTVTVVNPGSVSSPRGGETAGLAELLIDGKEWEYRVLHLT